jgi:hypothetical protein
VSFNFIGVEDFGHLLYLNQRLSCVSSHAVLDFSIASGCALEFSDYARRSPRCLFD